MAHCKAAIAIVLGMWIPSTMQAQTPLPNQIEKFVQKHCSDCHDGPDAEGGIDLYELDFDLSDEEITNIRAIVDANYQTEGDLRPVYSQNIKRLTEIGSAAGRRHRVGLPVRGQRTRTNARTRKGKVKVVVAKKK